MKWEYYVSAWNIRWYIFQLYISVKVRNLYWNSHHYIDKDKKIIKIRWIKKNMDFIIHKFVYVVYGIHYNIFQYHMNNGALLHSFQRWIIEYSILWATETNSQNKKKERKKTAQKKIKWSMKNSRTSSSFVSPFQP